jgi:hypothetical protein
MGCGSSTANNAHASSSEDAAASKRTAEIDAQLKRDKEAEK